MVSDIEWLQPNGAPATKRGKGSISYTVSHLPGVMAAVHAKARSIEMDARTNLAAHTRTGAAHVALARHENASTDTPDWYVYLRDVDPGGGDGEYVRKNRLDRSAMSIEFGWVQRQAFGKKLKTPIPHDGLNILGDAMGRAIASYGGPR